MNHKLITRINNVKTKH